MDRSSELMILLQYTLSQNEKKSYKIPNGEKLYAKTKEMDGEDKNYNRIQTDRRGCGCRGDADSIVGGLCWDGYKIFYRVIL